MNYISEKNYIYFDARVFLLSLVGIFVFENYLPYMLVNNKTNINYENMVWKFIYLHNRTNSKTVLFLLKFLLLVGAKYVCLMTISSSVISNKFGHIVFMLCGGVFDDYCQTMLKLSYLTQQKILHKILLNNG